jgi:hypothetical protein
LNTDTPETICAGIHSLSPPEMPQLIGDAEFAAQTGRSWWSKRWRSRKLRKLIGALGDYYAARSHYESAALQFLSTRAELTQSPSDPATENAYYAIEKLVETFHGACKAFSNVTVRADRWGSTQPKRDDEEAATRLFQSLARAGAMIQRGVRYANSQAVFRANSQQLYYGLMWLAEPLPAYRKRWTQPPPPYSRPSPAQGPQNRARVPASPYDAPPSPAAVRSPAHSGATGPDHRPRIRR